MVGGTLRVAGSARLPTGETLAWSIADGARGRRWRELLTRRGRMVRSLLLETDPGGGIARVELATGSGLLTVHPSADEATLHGNVVTPGGMRHLAIAWSGSRHLVVDGSPALAKVIVDRVGGASPDDEQAGFDGVWIGSDLRPQAVTVIVTRTGPMTWEIATSPAGRDRPQVLVLDERGLPSLADASEWPLER